ncbi:hypothetical protein ACLOJK_003388 [Asimina triloba]
MPAFMSILAVEIVGIVMDGWLLTEDNWELASTLKEIKPRLDSAGVKLIAVGVGTPSKARILAGRNVLEKNHLILCLVVDHTVQTLRGRQVLSSQVCQFDLVLFIVLTRNGYFQAYDVLGLYYGLGRTFFNPASAKVLSRLGSVQKAVQNYTSSATPDNMSGVLQQGGMFVFKGKQLLYARKDEGTGDHAPLDDVLAVCCSTTAVA